MSSKSKIFDIVGRPVSEISFVQDYVEVRCEEKILRALGAVSIHAGGQTFSFPESGSRDALCSFIGVIIREVKFEKESIEVGFWRGRIVFSLAGYEHDHGEFFHYVGVAPVWPDT